MSQNAPRHSLRPSLLRRLRVERLEDRRMLATVVVTNNLDVVNGDVSSVANLLAPNGDGGDGVSLREAIEAANATQGADQITFDFGHDGPETIVLTGGSLTAIDEVTITGLGMDLLTIDGSGSDPTPGETNGDGGGVFRFGIEHPDQGNQVAITAQLSDVAITNADADASVIDIFGEFTLARSRITGNAAEKAIINTVGSRSAFDLVIRDSVISANTGRAVRAYETDISISDTTISGNVGGAVDSSLYWHRRRLTVTDSTITGNSAEKGGGFLLKPLYAGGIDLRLERTVVSENSAGKGSAIHATQGSVEIIDSVIRDNRGDPAVFGDTAVRIEPSTAPIGTAGIPGGLRVTGSTIVGNTGVGISGAVGGELEIARSTISGNGKSGLSVGSFYLRNVTVSDSEFTDNGGAGLAVFADTHARIANTTITGNRDIGLYVNGKQVQIEDSVIAENHNGGIEIASLAEAATLTRSTVSGNFKAHRSGGGIYARYAHLSVIDSTISNNTLTDSDYVYGGGIFTRSAVTILRSTISGNEVIGINSRAEGGGLAVNSAVIHESTIVGNRATGNRVEGGAIWQTSGTLQIVDSIVSDNTVNGIESDLPTAGSLETIVRTSLIGHNSGTDLAESPVGSPDVDGNLVGGPIGGAIDPLIGPLANNGGPTKTHALLPDSPALDMGDPSTAFDESEFDQRGEGYFRVANGGGGLRADMGAYESQGVPIDFPNGDYNHDGIADALDYALWRETLGQFVPLGTGADGVADGLIDSQDVDFWRDNYGNTTLQLVLDSAAVASKAASDAALTVYSGPTTDRARRPASVRTVTGESTQAVAVDAELLLLLAVDVADSLTQEIHSVYEEVGSLPDRVNDQLAGITPLEGEWTE